MRSHAGVRAVLPHRHPALLVDRVDELEPFHHIVTRKAVSGSEPCYAGLGENLSENAYAYPTSLLLESFGQSGALLWLESLATTDHAVGADSLIFASARDVELHQVVLPGDVVRHVAHLERVVGDNAFLRGQSWVGDDLVMTVGTAIAVRRSATSLTSAHQVVAPRAVPQTALLT